MRFSTSCKTFLIDGREANFTFNVLEVEDQVTAFFIPCEDDAVAKTLTRFQTIYFEYSLDAQAWVQASEIELSDDLRSFFKSHLPVLRKRTVRRKA